MQPLDESLIEKLVEMGVDKETASKMTVGEYEDYMSSLQADNEHSSQPEDYSSSSDGSSDRTNQGAEDNTAHTGEKHYTAAQLEKINALGLTLDDVKTLNDKGFTIDDIVGMTKEKAGNLLTTNAAEWDCCLTFSYSGYDYHKPAENVSACFADTDWSWAFDGISAYLEENGKPVTGLINDGIKYKLVIKLKLDHKLDKYYGFSYVPKKQVKMNTKNQTSLPAKEYYSDGDYLIAKFELAPYESEYDTVGFTINGYSIGTNIDDITVIANMDGFGIHKFTQLYCRENSNGEYVAATGEIKAGWEYSLVIMYTVPEGTEVYFGADAILYGASKSPIVTNNGQNQIMTHEGIPVYMTIFYLPILK
ncbi:MAG: hypothetical protein J5756_00600 [Clostridia bacterium]|nr:hypothetical protein [Clostridia bacterium]